MFECSKFNDIVDQFDEKNNSHSFIFYTNDFVLCKNDVISLVKKVFNCDNLSKINSDFIIINSDDKRNILKSDTEQIKDFFQSKSYINNYRIYLIEEAHKLNSSSANLILKFLEEPFDGVVGMFITTNLDAVLNTIKSRCQIINCFYDSENIKIENDFDLVEKLFVSNPSKIIFNIKKEYENIDRSDILNLFKCYLIFCYNSAINEEKYFSRIIVLNKAISMLNNNVNTDYVLDYILLESR